MDLWEKTLNIISKEMKQTVFDSWIRPIRSIQEDESGIVLEVNNSFQQKFIEKNYGDQIRKALKEITQKDISVLYRIVEKEKPAFPAISLINEASIATNKPKTQNVRKRFFERFTFDSFVVGDSNRIAYSACQAVANNPGTNYNPLFLVGKRGVGKTHLLHSIGNFLFQTRPDFAVKYATLDEFSMDYTSCLQNKDEWPVFNRKYKEIDILLFDDVNLFAGKEKFQESFLQFFNYLFLEGKQIVLTSDRPPKEIPYLQSRLCNRFEQGLLVQIHSPDMATRQNILRRLAQQANFAIESKYIAHIASKLTEDIRELEGVMNRLILECRTLSLPVSTGLIDNILELFMDKYKKTDISLQKIMEKVAAIYTIPVTALKDKRKDNSILVPRQVAMYVAQELTNIPVTDIGREFGKTHSVVIHSCNRIKESLSKDIVLKNNVDKIISDLKDGF
jgi:chromosomal replication initiator protein